MNLDELSKKFMKLGSKLFIIMLIWYGYLYLADVFGIERAIITLGFFGILILSGNLSSLTNELRELNKKFSDRNG